MLGITSTISLYIALLVLGCILTPRHLRTECDGLWRCSSAWRETHAFASTIMENIVQTAQKTFRLDASLSANLTLSYTGRMARAAPSLYQSTHVEFSISCNYIETVSTDVRTAFRAPNGFNGFAQCALLSALLCSSTTWYFSRIKWSVVLSDDE